MKISLTTKIFIGLVAGVLLGYFAPSWGIAMRPLSTLFLNLIKSIIAPLIFSALVIGLGAVNFTKPGVGVSLTGAHRPDDKATLADRAKSLASEANAAAAKG